MSVRNSFAPHLISALFLVGCLLPGCKSGGEEKPDDKEEMTDQKQKQPDAGRQDGETITDKMAEEHEGDEPTPTGAIEGDPRQPVTTSEVTYATLGDEGITGYFAQPKETEGTPPGIIVIQEWWGLNDNIRKMTRLLAGEGYAALAVDLYEGKVAESPDKARKLMQQAMQNKDRVEQNLRQAHQYLDQEVGSERIGVIGWCFGGGWSLQTALMMPDEIDATVIYYGQLTTDPEQLEKLNMPILGIFGSEDTAIPIPQVRKFEDTLQELDKDVEIHIYEGADHAFANPSGQRYNPEAAQAAWEQTVTFLETHLKK